MKSTTNSLRFDKLTSVAVLHHFQQNIATQNYEKFDILRIDFNFTSIPKQNQKASILFTELLHISQIMGFKFIPFFARFSEFEFFGKCQMIVVHKPYTQLFNNNLYGL